MSDLRLADAAGQVLRLGTDDLKWVLTKLEGDLPKGATKTELRAAVTAALQQGATGDGENAVVADAAAEALAGVGEGRPVEMKQKPEKELNVAVEIAKLQKMSTGQLRERFTAEFGKPVKTGNRAYLVKKLVYRLQEKVHGGLSDKAKARAAEIVDTTGVGTKTVKQAKEAKPRDPRLPAPGSLIVKEWRDQHLEVLVGESDFEFRGERFRSLSAISSKLLNTPSNGFLFFNLLPAQKEAAEKRAAKQAEKEAKAAEAAATSTEPAPEAPKPAKKAKKPAKPAKKGAK